MVISRDRSILVGVTAALSIQGAACLAGDVLFIRVGDVDGFGLEDGEDLLNAEGDPCNVDGVGVLGIDDFLPDWNQDGLVQDFQGDDFDARTTTEIAGASIEASGFVDVASGGSQFTDLSLSQSYDSTFGVPNDFPDPPSTNRNDVHLTFDFSVPVADLTAGSPVFFNIVFGDIGLVPSDLVLTFSDGSSVTIVIEPINPSTDDGLIKGAFAELDFDDVFTQSGDTYEGLVEVALVTRPDTTNGDPYYAVDYAELSTVSLITCPADLTNDGQVDGADLGLLLGAWGPCRGCPADLTDDGLVNGADLGLLLGAWGPCSR